MSYFEKNGAFFPKEKCAKESTSAMGNVILEMQQCIVHSADLIHSLSLAMAFSLRESVYLSVSDIKLFELRDRETKTFLGSCYAVLYKGLYYANIVGSREVFSCKRDAFLFKKTDELWVPVYRDPFYLYILRCHFNRRTRRIKVLKLVRRDKENKTEETLHCFAKEVSFTEAFETAKRLSKCN